MNPELRERLLAALERPHRLGMIGGDLEEQLAHCASFSSVLGQVWPVDRDGTALDLGTGGGLPGLALAALWPHLHWTLVEMRSSRATEVELAALRLGVENVTVVAQAAQNLAHGEYRHGVDVIVARAFGPPSLVAECAGGLLRVGGSLVVSEPPASTSERWPTDALGVFGFGPARGEHDGDHRFVTMVLEALPDPSVPRRPPRNDRGWLER